MAHLREAINTTWHFFAGFIGEPTGQPQSFTEYIYIDCQNLSDIYHFISWQHGQEWFLTRVALQACS